MRISDWSSDVCSSDLAMDGVWFDPADEDGLKQEAQRVAAMGFTGKASYDARQIPHIHAAFTPSAEAVDHARRVLAAAAAATLGTTRLAGRMINESLTRSARRVIALADRAGHDAGTHPYPATPNNPDHKPYH